MPIFDLREVNSAEKLAEFLCQVLSQQQYQNGSIVADYGGGRDDDIDVILPDGLRLRFRVTVEMRAEGGPTPP